MWRWLVVYICDNYMLLELWMLLVIVYMLSGGELLLITHIQVLVMLMWLVCVNICIVVESYVHAFMTDGGGFYIQLSWLQCFCCIGGDDLEVIWYRMHLDESRAIAYIVGELKYNWVVHGDWNCYLLIDMVEVVIRVWYTCWYELGMMILNDLEWFRCCEYLWIYVWFAILYSWIYLSFPMFLIKSYMDYDDVMLTLSGLPPAFPYGRVDGMQDA
jgi:hypothetical protein